MFMRIGLLSLLIVLAISLVLPLPEHTSAQNIPTVISKDEVGVDVGLIEQADNYVPPQFALVTPVFLDADVSLDSEEWYKGMFYYFSSDRYLFKDIPTHYVIDKSGRIYQGIEGGVERELVIDGVSAAPIVIMYMAERGDRDFSLSAQDTITNLLQQLTNENDFESEDLRLEALHLSVDEQERRANLEIDDLYGTWQVTFDQISSQVIRNYKPQPKNYQVEIVEYNGPRGVVAVGDEVIVSLTLKNTGQHTIFPGSDAELLFTRANGEDSKYWINDKWVSKTQVQVLDEDDILRPGDELEFQLSLRAPFEEGNYSEEFVITAGSSEALPNTEVAVAMEIERGNLRVLRVTDTETGTLNVRTQPGIGGEVITGAVPGEKYIWTDQQGDWYKIRIGDDEGWVSGRYVDEL